MLIVGITQPAAARIVVFRVQRDHLNSKFIFQLEKQITRQHSAIIRLSFFSETFLILKMIVKNTPGEMRPVDKTDQVSNGPQKAESNTK